MRTKFNPCGMIFTYLRSCYSFTLRVFVGGVETLIPARWYFAASGAKVFPGVHGCESSVWLKNYELNDGWGEVTPYPTDPASAQLRGLDRGKNPGYPGHCFTGEQQWFVDGQLPAGILDSPPPPFDPCCMPLQFKGTGGILLGGSAVASFKPSGFHCLNCREGIQPAVMRVTGTGGTGQFANLNGSFDLPASLVCEYEGTVGGIHFVIDGSNGVFWQILINDFPTGGFVLYRVNGKINCLSAQTGWVPTSIGTGTPPAIVTQPGP